MTGNPIVRASLDHGRSTHVSVDQRPEIENLLLEERVFPPDPAFSAQANAQAASTKRPPATPRPSGRRSPARR